MSEIQDDMELEPIGTKPQVPQSFALPPGGGKTVSLWGSKVTVYITGEQTGGAYAFFEYFAPPGQAGPPLHVHRHFDEVFYILEGTLRLQIGEQLVVLEPGSCAVAARGTPHRVENVGTTMVRGLTMISPAGFEQYFLELGELAASLSPGPPPAERIQEIAAKYDVHNVL